ncbi:MAG: hypothetical protein RQ750_03630 [Roseovarius sp.]|nr:hypothetical protein [Roseovarius sp.]
MNRDTRQNPSFSDLPEVLAGMQARVEALYLENLTLSQEMKVLRAAPPVVMLVPGRRWWFSRYLGRVFPRINRRLERDIIRGSGLFDPEWYLEANEDVAKAGIDPVDHFLKFGMVEQRDPGPYFDIRHYLHLYPDIAARGINPLVHYVMYGRSEGRSIRPGMLHGDGA